MTTADLPADVARMIAELRPFIVRRIQRGQSFEAALRAAPQDAHEYALNRRQQILDEVYDRLAVAKEVTQ